MPLCGFLSLLPVRVGQGPMDYPAADHAAILRRVRNKPRLSLRVCVSLFTTAHKDRWAPIWRLDNNLLGDRKTG